MQAVEQKSERQFSRLQDLEGVVSTPIASRDLDQQFDQLAEEML